MTVEQREKIQHAIQALIDVESALQHTATDDKPHPNPDIIAVQDKLHDARTSLISLNAPEYN